MNSFAETFKETCTIKDKHVLRAGRATTVTCREGYNNYVQGGLQQLRAGRATTVTCREGYNSYVQGGLQQLRAGRATTVTCRHIASVHTITSKIICTEGVDALAFRTLTESGWVDR
jgi:hypothetical protein